MARKADTISYKEFNQLTKSKEHQIGHEGILFDDENIDQLEETLMGMEYDVEDLSELEDQEESEINLESSGEDENEEENSADLDDELDESVFYKGRNL